VLAVLSKNQFRVKKPFGMLIAANNFDIFDPDSHQKFIECRQPDLGFFTKISRFMQGDIEIAVLEAADVAIVTFF